MCWYFQESPDSLEIIDLFTFFSNFDMDKLGKIRRHHWKSVLKLIKLLSLKLICWKLMKKQLLKVTKLYRLLYGGGHKLTPHHTNICKFSELYLRSLKMLSLSNLAIILLILRCSFRWCQRVFSNWPIQKVEKTMKRSIARENPNLNQATNKSWCSETLLLVFWNALESFCPRYFPPYFRTRNITLEARLFCFTAYRTRNVTFEARLMTRK